MRLTRVKKTRTTTTNRKPSVTSRTATKSRAMKLPAPKGPQEATVDGISQLKEVASKQAATRSTKKTRGKDMPIIDVNDQVKNLVDEFNGNKNKIDELTTKNKAIGDQVVAETNDSFEARCRVDKKWHTSAALGHKDEELGFIIIRQTTRAEIGGDKESAAVLKGLSKRSKSLGTDFVKISLKTEITKDQTALRALMGLIPAAVLDQYFDVVTTFKPDEGIQEDYYADEIVREAIDELVEAGAMSMKTYLKSAGK